MSDKIKLSFQALKTIIIYFIIGVLWILFSDRVLNSLAPNQAVLTQLQILKGWFFITITSLLLYFLIRRYALQIHKSIVERQALEKHLDFFTRYANDIILLTDEKGSILEANERAFEFYGYGKDRLLNLSYSDLSVDRDELLSQPIQSKLKNEGGLLYESVHTHANGRTSPVEVSAKSIEVENKKFFQFIIRDITERQRSTTALEESEKRFRELAELLPQAVFEINMDGSFIFGNENGLNMFGFTKQDIAGEITVFDMIAEDEKEVAMKNFSKLLVGKASGLNEYTAVRKDGSTFSCLIYANTIIRENKAVGLRGILIDNSEQKKVEEVLRQNEVRYRKLVESSPDAIFLHCDNKIAFVNSAAVKLLNAASADDIMGRPIYDFIHPDYSEIAAENIRKLYANELTSTFMEKTFIRADGSQVQVETAASSIVFNDKTSIQIVARDLTWRKEAEKQIRILSRVVEQSPNSILITDTTGKIEYVNPSFTKLTGYCSEEVIGQNPRIVNSGKNSSELYKNLWETILSGQEWRGELLNKKKDGTIYWEYTLISPLRDSKNNITHFISIKDDITKHKEMTEELIKAKEKAEESDRLKSEFLAQMSHEIRTPLNVILSFNALLSEEAADKLSDDFKDTFGLIDRAGKRLLRTLNHILNMAAVQTGNFELNFSDVNMTDVIENFIIEFENAAKVKKLKLTYKNLTDNTAIKTDEYIASEILQNLIDNAIKYTPEGSVDVEMWRNQNFDLCIKVKDTGIGISEKYLPKLFQPFTQEESGYSRTFEGNGLGLALVKNFADLIGAEIKVRSEKGKGSEFILIFHEQESK